MGNQQSNNSLQISMFNNVWDTKNEELKKNYEVGFILGIIKTGNYGVAEKIDDIRNAASKAEHDDLKMNLQVIMWQGVFSSRNNNGCESLSSLVCIDVDHQTEEVLKHVKQTLATWPYVLACFRSPSGDGLKVIVKTNNLSIEDYGNCYRQLARLFADSFGIKPDGRTEDLSHPCFISYDPNCYYNPEATSWTYEYKPEFDKPVNAQYHRSSSGSAGQDEPLSSYDMFMANLNKARCPLTDEQIITILDIKWSKSPSFYEDGNRTKSIFVQALTLSKAGIDEQKALDYIRSKFIPTGYDDYKLQHEVSQAYSKSRHLFASERSRYKTYSEYRRNH